MLLVDNNIKIMVVGYQTQEDEKGIVLDIVDNISIAEANDDEYISNYAYTDFIECVKHRNQYMVKGISYKIGDKFIF